MVVEPCAGYFCCSNHLLIDLDLEHMDISALVVAVADAVVAAVDGFGDCFGVAAARDRGWSGHQIDCWFLACVQDVERVKVELEVYSLNTRASMNHPTASV